jgi:hypothetical protein
MLSEEQIRAAFVGPCLSLNFLVRPELRDSNRREFEGFSDSAIFHRLHGLCWTLQEPEIVSLLTLDEKNVLAAFNNAFDCLPWRPIESHPHISELPGDDLSTLMPLALELLQLLERRTRSSRITLLWRQIVTFWRGVLRRW